MVDVRAEAIRRATAGFSHEAAIAFAILDLADAVRDASFKKGGAR